MMNFKLPLWYATLLEKIGLWPTKMVPEMNKENPKFPFDLFVERLESNFKGDITTVELPGIVLNGNKVMFQKDLATVRYSHYKSLIKEKKNLEVGTNDRNPASYGKCYANLYSCFGFECPQLGNAPSLSELLSDFLPKLKDAGYNNETFVPDYIFSDGMIHFTSSEAGIILTVSDLLALSKNKAFHLKVAGEVKLSFFNNYKGVPKDFLFELLCYHPECWDLSSNKFSIGIEKVFAKDGISNQERMERLEKILSVWSSKRKTQAFHDEFNEYLYVLNTDLKGASESQKPKAIRFSKDEEVLSFSIDSDLEMDWDNVFKGQNVARKEGETKKMSPSNVLSLEEDVDWENCFARDKGTKRTEKIFNKDSQSENVDWDNCFKGTEKKNTDLEQRKEGRKENTILSKKKNKGIEEDIIDWDNCFKRGRVVEKDDIDWDDCFVKSKQTGENLEEKRMVTQQRRESDLKQISDDIDWDNCFLKTKEEGKKEENKEKKSVPWSFDEDKNFFEDIEERKEEEKAATSFLNPFKQVLYGCKIDFKRHCETDKDSSVSDGSTKEWDFDGQEQIKGEELNKDLQDNVKNLENMPIDASACISRPFKSSSFTESMDYLHNRSSRARSNRSRGRGRVQAFVFHSHKEDFEWGEQRISTKEDGILVVPKMYPPPTKSISLNEEEQEEQQSLQSVVNLEVNLEDLELASGKTDTESFISGFAQTASSSYFDPNDKVYAAYARPAPPTIDYTKKISDIPLSRKEIREHIDPTSQQMSEVDPSLRTSNWVSKIKRGDTFDLNFLRALEIYCEEDVGVENLEGEASDMYDLLKKYDDNLISEKDLQTRFTEIRFGLDLNDYKKEGTTEQVVQNFFMSPGDAIDQALFSALNKEEEERKEEGNAFESECKPSFDEKKAQEDIVTPVKMSKHQQKGDYQKRRKRTSSQKKSGRKSTSSTISIVEGDLPELKIVDERRKEENLHSLMSYELNQAQDVHRQQKILTGEEVPKTPRRHKPAFSAASYGGQVKNVMFRAEFPLQEETLLSFEVRRENYKGFIDFHNCCYAKALYDLLSPFGIFCTDLNQDGEQHSLLDYWIKTAEINNAWEFIILVCTITKCLHCGSLFRRHRIQLMEYASFYNQEAIFLSTECSVCHVSNCLLQQTWHNFSELALFFSEEKDETHFEAILKSVREGGMVILKGIRHTGDKGYGHYALNEKFNTCCLTNQKSALKHRQEIFQRVIVNNEDPDQVLISLDYSPFDWFTNLFNERCESKLMPKVQEIKHTLEYPIYLEMINATFNQALMDDMDQQGEGNELNGFVEEEKGPKRFENEEKTEETDENTGEDEDIDWDGDLQRKDGGLSSVQKRKGRFKEQDITTEAGYGPIKPEDDEMLCKIMGGLKLSVKHTEELYKKRPEMFEAYYE